MSFMEYSIIRILIKKFPYLTENWQISCSRSGTGIEESGSCFSGAIKFYFCFTLFQDEAMPRSKSTPATVIAAGRQTGQSFTSSFFLIRIAGGSRSSEQLFASRSFS